MGLLLIVEGCAIPTLNQALSSMLHPILEHVQLFRLVTLGVRSENGVGLQACVRQSMIYRPNPLENKALEESANRTGNITLRH